jgi:hypothetical protein
MADDLRWKKGRGQVYLGVQQVDPDKSIPRVLQAHSFTHPNWYFTLATDNFVKPNTTECCHNFAPG